MDKPKDTIPVRIAVMGEKGAGMTYRAFATSTKITIQCPWLCPICGTQCGGVAGHKGKHQCRNHYKPKREK